MPDTALREIDEAMIALRRLWAAPARIRDAQLGTVDMSTIWVVHSLVHHGGSATVSALAHDMDVVHSTASRLVSRAEHSGAVIRKDDPDDHRSVLVEMTAAGRRLADEALRFRLELLADATADFSPDEREHFAALLTRFAHAATTKGEP